MKKKVKDTLRITGRVKLTVSDPKTGRVVAQIKTKNLICTVGKQLVGDMLIDLAGYDTGLTYCAIGTSTTAPTIADIVLGAEAARKAITSKARVGNDITFSTFFPSGDCTFDIQECGIFGHSTAGAGADTGVLFAHALIAYDNGAGSYDLTFDWTITISA